jgi:cell division GTPase FtsZ
MVTINVNPEANKNMLIIGAGEAGGRIACEFSLQGFPNVIAINTAKADLDGLELSDDNKFLIPVTKGAGAGKDPNVVRNAIDSFYEDVLKFIRSKAAGAEYVLVCIGGGGGTGGGLGIVMAQIVSEIGLPVGVIYTIPRSNEGTLVFVNALDNLKEIHQNAQDAAISPMIVVDNNKLVKEFNPTASNFWGPLNSAIVRVVRKFNEYSVQPSKFISALDRQDLKRLLSTGGVCAIGELEISAEYSEEQLMTQIAEHFFMDGFDLSTSTACGVIVTGTSATLGTSSSAKCIETIFDKISQLLGGGMFFKGVYEDGDTKFLKIYVIFNGLALPSEQIDEMMKSIRTGYQKIKTQQNRLDGVHVDFGSGVGGMFNQQSASKKIVRKSSVNVNVESEGENVENVPVAPNSPTPQTPRNPINIPGIKRGGR